MWNVAPLIHPAPTQWGHIAVAEPIFLFLVNTHPPPPIGFKGTSRTHLLSIQVSLLSIDLRTLITLHRLSFCRGTDVKGSPTQLPKEVRKPRGRAEK